MFSCPWKKFETMGFMGTLVFHYFPQLVIINNKSNISFSFLSSSKDTEEMSETFCLVFILMWVGGTVVTINAILLGSKM